MTSPAEPARRDILLAQAHLTAAAAALGLELRRDGIDRDEGSPLFEAFTNIALAYDDLGVLLDPDGV